MMSSATLRLPVRVRDTRCRPDVETGLAPPTGGGPTGLEGIRGGLARRLVCVSENSGQARVGAQLRQLRVAQGIDGQVLARELGWSGAKLSRIEQGKIRVSVTDLASALSALGSPEEVRAEMLATVAGGTLGAWMVRSGGVVRRQAEVGHLEQRVTALAEYHPLLVPGQLQSRGYTHAMAEAAGFDPQAVASARAVRQGLLAVEGAPIFRAILDERTFARWAGDSDVMIDQIDYILARLRLPNIEVNLLADGPNAKNLALDAFVIYDFTSTNSVVLLEHQFLDVFLATEADVEQYRQTFFALREEAMESKETVQWLLSKRDELKERS